MTTNPLPRRRLIGKAFVAFAGALIATAPAFAQKEIKLGHVGEPGSLFQKSADEFARRANAKLGDKAKVVVYGSSQLGGDKEMIQKLKLGTIDMALPSTVMSSEVDLFGIFEMPYIVKDRAHMAKIEKDVFWPMLAPEAEKKGLQGHRRVGKRLPPHHQQQAADQGAGRPAGHQAARARRQVAREDVPGLRREPEPDEVLRALHRAADRRDGRPGESVHADLLARSCRRCRSTCRCRATSTRRRT